MFACLHQFNDVKVPHPEFPHFRKAIKIQDLVLHLHLQLQLVEQHSSLLYAHHDGPQLLSGSASPPL